MAFINIGYGNIVNDSKIVAMIVPDSAPSKRLIQSARESGLVIDATQGRRTRGVLVTESGQVILSALVPETLAERCRKQQLESIGQDMDERNGNAGNET